MLSNMHSIINEEKIKEVLYSILTEEKVSRQEYSRVQFKLDELSSSLNETIKDLRKLDDAIPAGLKGTMNGKIASLSSALSGSQKTVEILKSKVKDLKRASFAQQVDEKTKK